MSPAKGTCLVAYGRYQAPLDSSSDPGQASEPPLNPFSPMEPWAGTEISHEPEQARVYVIRILHNILEIVDGQVQTAWPVGERCGRPLSFPLTHGCAAVRVVTKANGRESVDLTEDTISPVNTPPGNRLTIIPQIRRTAHSAVSGWNASKLQGTLIITLCLSGAL